MANNLPPGVSVSDLPGNRRKDYNVPMCKHCLNENREAWHVETEGGAGGAFPVVYCDTHGRLNNHEVEIQNE